MLHLERQYWAKGVTRLAGIDEAGRGPLAGPVIAAAVVFNREFAEREESGLLHYLTDSKKLTEKRRRYFYEIFDESSDVEFAVGVAGSAEIDKINILRATHAAMLRAIHALAVKPTFCIIDGLPVEGLPCESRAVVRGDSASLSIAAASVVAKVVRDGVMIKYDELYPEYGFAQHKGYGTSAHVQALLEHGPTPIHRRSFRPVREAEEIRLRSLENRRE